MLWIIKRRNNTLYLQWKITHLKMIITMKRYTFIILSLIATLSYSCSGLEVEGVWVKPPQLVQAYINPEIHGLGAEGLEDGLVVLLPCNVGQYSVLSSDPKAYITNQSNNRVYDSLRTVHNDHNSMAIRYVFFRPPLDMMGGYHYQVLWKDIEKIDVKVDRDFGEYAAGSSIAGIMSVTGLINMKEELSRSPQPEYFPDERYSDRMTLNQFNSCPRSMVALPLVLSITGMESLPVNKCSFIVELTFTDGTTILTSTGEVEL